MQTVLRRHRSNRTAATEHVARLPRTVRSRRIALALAASTSLMVACSTPAGSTGSAAVGNAADALEVSLDDTDLATADATTDDTATDETSTVETTSAASGSSGTVDLGGVGSLSSTQVHEISITFDQTAYDEMIAAYQADQSKVWIEATVTIDGRTFERVGLRLKGNSSLFALSGRGSTNGTTADDPASLPWLIDLDHFVEQDLDGLTEMVVRSNSTTTALNEAVALELLDAAGLASQDAIAVALSVNGGAAVLRLVIDNPDGTWMEEEFGEGGALYKAEAEGDYSYRGNDPDAYTDVFDQEAGKDDTDLTPLIDFLEFVNDSDDATFAAELSERLDVDAFATYLAFQTLIDNRDDIDGPGNNSYLHYDLETGMFTVVSWDLNLAFGTANVVGGPGGDGMGGGGMGGGATDDDGAGGPPVGGGGGMGGGMGGGPGGMEQSNVLVERFLAVDEWSALVDAKLAELQASLFDSGTARAVLDQWSAIVSSSGLVDEATVSTEASAVSSAF